MLSDNEKYKRLIIRCLQGEATAVEQQKAEHWVNSSDENSRLFNSYKDLLLLTTMDGHVYNAEVAWSKVKERMHNSKGLVIEPKPRVNLSRVFRMAVPAVAALLLIGVGIFSLMKRAPEMLKFATTDELAATLQLPDGSSLSLNANSVINYPEKFKGQTREVTLSGEAFFEVYHNPERPFVVHADGLDIRVTGTQLAGQQRVATRDDRVGFSALAGRVGHRGPADLGLAVTFVVAAVDLSAQCLA